MVLTSPDGSLQIRLLVFSNKTVYGALCGESKKLISSGCLSKKTESKAIVNAQKTTKRPFRKDPEDNLGNVISVLDTVRIEKGVDYTSISEAVESIMKKENITLKELFSSRIHMERLCRGFELTLQELITMMMENNHSTFNMNFIKTVIKPFVSEIKDEKYHFDNETELNKGYDPIFDFI